MLRNFGLSQTLLAFEKWWPPGYLKSNPTPNPTPTNSETAVNPTPKSRRKHQKPV